MENEGSWALCSKRHKKEEALKLVLWQPQHGQTKLGRPKSTYIHTLLEDTKFATVGVMLDQIDW